MDIGHEPRLVPPDPPPADEWDDLLVAADRLGREDGRGAAAPLDLSGQWADGPTPRGIITRVFTEARADLDDWPPYDQVDWNDILDVYEESYNEAAYPTYVAGEDDPPDAYELGVVGD